MGKHNLLVKLVWLLFFLNFSLSHAKAQLWIENFSSDTMYSVTLGAEGASGPSDYFKRTDGSDIGVTYSGLSGYFFAGQDIDDSGWTGSANPSQLTWSGIDISGESGLEFSGNFASAATNKIDKSDYVLVEYRIDDGNWVNLLAFENDGSTYNTKFGEDSDFDGVSDGSDLSGTFSSFTKRIPETGSMLDLRITIAINAGGEDFAFDEFVIEEYVVQEEPSNHVTNFLATGSDYDQIDLYWDENNGVQPAEGFLIKVSSEDYSSILPPSDGNEVPDDNDLTDGKGAVNINPGVENFLWKGLESSTDYYFKIYPYTNTGSDIDYKTDGTVPEVMATTNTAPAIPSLIISEVADPADNYKARFVELYNTGDSTLDLDNKEIYLSRQSNGGNWEDKKLTGKIAPGAVYVAANRNDDIQDDFFITYHIIGDFDFGGSTGNGDDGYFLYVGGDHSSGILFDAYGVIDEDGSGTAWEYEDKRAIRKDSVASPNSTWSSGEWIIASANVTDMTPAAHIDYTTFSGAVDESWNTVANWTGGSVPSSTSDASIPHNGRATIKASAVCNNLTLESNNKGTASLIGTENLTINGKAIVEQYLAETSQFYNWHYVTTPVNGASAKVFPGVTHNSQTVYASAWDESNDQWNNFTSDHTLNPLQGYAVPFSTDTTIQFSGDLITGNQNTPVLNYHTGNSYAGFHLVGNPFTAAMDASKLQGSGWSEDIWVRTSGDFEEYNVASSVGTLPGGIIPAMQGFWIRTTSDEGVLEFETANLLHDATVLYKAEISEQLELQVSHENYSDKIIVYCHPGAKNSFDRYDTEKMFAEDPAYPQIYTRTEDHSLAINGIEPINKEKRTIAMGFKSSMSGEFSIEATNLGSFGSLLDIYLRDNETNDIIDLRKERIYSFHSNTSTKQDDRFTVIFSPTGVTSLNSLKNENFDIWSSGTDIYIRSDQSGSATLKVHDITGRPAYSNISELHKGVNRIPLNLQPGVYLVSLQKDDEEIIQQIIIK